MIDKGKDMQLQWKHFIYKIIERKYYKFFAPKHSRFYSYSYTMKNEIKKDSGGGGGVISEFPRNQSQNRATKQL